MQEHKEGYTMAAAKKTTETANTEVQNTGATKAEAPKKEKSYTVRVKGNKEFCGKGAGGAQFAYGEAKITDAWLAEWFRTHEGYEVTEQ